VAVAVAGIALIGPASSAEVRIRTLPDGSKLMYNTGQPAKSGSSGSSRRVVTPLRPPVELAALVERHALAQKLDPRLVDAVVRVESAYNPRALSHKGAIGLMQLMPATARILSVDPWLPEDNLAGGTRYLRSLLDRFDGELDLALAGYNAGPGAVERYRGVPPYDETRAYVERVLRLYYGRSDFSLPERGRRVYSFRDAQGRLVFTTSPPS
jgi:soluble lytic murein transglycosylase-like protein